MPYDVFISYASGDKAIADVICEALENRGLKCWIAPRNIVVGSYGAAIIKAIRNSKMMVLVLSSNANQSEHVHREVERAADKGISIYPVRIEDVLPSEDLELFISSEQWLDLFASPLEKHLEQLIQNVELLLGDNGGRVAAAPSRSPGLVRLKSSIQPSWVAITMGGLILLLIGWIWFKSGRGDTPNTQYVNANFVISPSPLASATHAPTHEVQGPSPVAIATTVAPSLTIQVTPTPTSKVAESLEGTLWEYSLGSNVRYVWDFQPGGRFRSRLPDKGTYFPDGTWVQMGETVTIRTSITTDHPETYKGKIRGDRMNGTVTGLGVNRWSATKMTP